MSELPSSRLNASPALESLSRQRLLNFFLKLLLGLCILTAVTTIPFDPKFSAGQISTLVLAVVFAAMLWITNRGYYTLVSYFLIGALWLTAGYMLYEAGSIANPDVTIYFFLLMLSALLLNRRDVILLTIASLTVISGLYYLELRGLITPHMQTAPNTGDFMSLVSMLVLTLGALYYLILQKDRQYRYVSDLNVELQQAQLEQAALLESIPDTLLKIDADANVLFVQDSPVLPDGTPFVKAGDNGYDMFAADQQAALKHMIKATLSGDTLQNRRTWLQIGTEQRLLDFRLMPITNSEILAICRDVTEDERLRQALHQAHKLDSIGVLVGGIAHDFNNWLTGVIVQLSLAQKRVNKLLQIPDAKLQAGKISDHLQKSVDAANQAADLTKQLLVYAGKKQPELSNVQINGLVRESLKLMDAALDKRIGFQKILGSDLPFVIGDGIQLQQVIVNLILNAGEAISSGAGTVKISTELVHLDAQAFPELMFVGSRRPTDGKYVQIQIADTGDGISQQNLKKMFDPFFTTKKNGKGLGLSATLGIIQAHKGGLSVQSQLGKGTTFDVFLPVGGTKPMHTQPLRMPVSKMQGTVLIIDDEASVRDAASGILEFAGLNILAAEDGAQGLVRLANHPEIDLVLLDIQMPKMNGVEVLVELRKTHPDLPVLLSTGYTDLDLHTLRKQHNVAAILQKPYVPDTLLHLIAPHLQ